jgi:nucleotide-binding universal stress UspA family protein
MEIACVVAAVDGSLPSLHALDWAADEASRRGVRLVLVHACLRERYEEGTADEEGPTSEREEVRRVLTDSVERAAKRYPDLLVESDVLPQETVAALLGLGHLAPLLVLGSRGHGGFAGLLLGSVSLKVAARAEYPVVVVRGGPSDRKPWHGGVVLGVGERGMSRAAVDFAVAEARLMRTELHLLHAWTPEPAAHERSGRDRCGGSAQHARDVVNAVLLPEGADEVKVRRFCAPGTGGSVLNQAGADAHLIVLGAHRTAGRGAPRLGPVDHAVLQHAVCPVAIVPGS